MFDFRNLRRWAGRRAAILLAALLAFQCTPQDGCVDTTEDEDSLSALILAASLQPARPSGPTDPCPSNSYSYKSTIGTPGSGDSELQEPWGLAISPAGKLFITDISSGRVRRFSLDGTFEAVFGTASSSPLNGDFDTPVGIAVDTDGNIYVAEIGNVRVQKLDSSGNHIASIATSGSGDGQFTVPWDLDLGPDQNLAVSDVTANRVQKITTSGVFVTKFGSTGSGDGQFNDPEGLAVDPSTGAIYVSSATRIQKFDSSGNFLLKWGTSGSGEGQFTGTALGLAVDAAGNVYAVDTGGRRVQKFDSEGRFLISFGSLGTGNGQFQEPKYVVVDNTGSVYVSDRSRRVIEVFGCNP